MATKVFHSQVFISEILPEWIASPQISCTSYGIIFHSIVLPSESSYEFPFISLQAVLCRAKASTFISSKSADIFFESFSSWKSKPSNFALNSAVLFFTSSKLKSLNCASASWIFEIILLISWTLFSLGSPNNFLINCSIINFFYYS